MRTGHGGLYAGLAAVLRTARQSDWRAACGRSYECLGSEQRMLQHKARCKGRKSVRRCLPTVQRAVCGAETGVQPIFFVMTGYYVILADEITSWTCYQSSTASYSGFRGFPEPSPLRCLELPSLLLPAAPPLSLLLLPSVGSAGGKPA